MEDFYRQKEVWQGSSSHKEWIVLGKVTFLWGKVGWAWGSYQADDLTSANQIIPDGLVKGYIPGRGCNCN